MTIGKTVLIVNFVRVSNMSVWDKIDFEEFTGEEKPVDPKLQKLLSKSHDKIVQLEEVHQSEHRKNQVRKSLEKRTFEERSEMSSRGWETGDKTHISNLGKEYADENRKRLSKYYQDSEHQSWAASHSKGGEKLWKTTYKEPMKCPHCPKVGKGMIMYKNHFDRCKKNPNRVIEYKYELVMDGKSYGKFEEKQGIAEYLECSAALVSKYMSGKKKDIKGYQIIDITL